MSDIEHRWNDLMDEVLARNKHADVESIERRLLNGCMFDSGDPYIASMARRVLDSGFYSLEDEEDEED